MATWSEVKGLEDGQYVDAETFNKPISQLASRTDYLKNRLDALGEIYTNIQVQVTLVADDTPAVGDIVCVDPDTKYFRKAIASMDLYDAFTASEKAFAVGILVSKTELSGTVILYGKVNLQDMPVDDMVDGGIFVNGQYYLSSSTPGKITRFPTGPRILLGFFSRNPSVAGALPGAFALLNPQHMDIEAHSHRTYVLEPRPSGGAEEVDGEVKVIGYWPNGFEPTYDSNDQEEFSGIPRLTIGGDYTSEDEATYTVTIQNADGDKPTKWPCQVKWSAEGVDEGEGIASLRFFGDEAPIGTLGMTVRLEPSYGMSESSPYQGEDGYRVWTVDRKLARGWSDCSVHASSDFGSNLVAFAGYPDTQKNDIRIYIPKKVYDLTAMTVEVGTELTIDGESFFFGDYDTPDQEGKTKILIGDVYESMVALAQKCDKVIYDENLKQALCIADCSETSLPSRSNEENVWFAVVYHTDTGVSVSNELNGWSISDVQSSYEIVPLNNGMTFKIIGSEPRSVGDEGSVSAFFHVLGACYRYNIEFDNDLKKHFPPVPARSGSLMLNGVELESYHMFPGDNWFDSPAVYGIGDDSIYWRDNSPGRQPWPTGLPDVPTEDEYRLLFHFVSEFHSETGPVTSLHPAKDSPITIKRCGTTDDATVGDLELDVDLVLDVNDKAIPGYKAVKTSRSGKLLLGPMVEKIVAGPGISIAQRAGQPNGQGTVTISADGAQYAGDFETVALENAKLESIGMFPYVRFLKWDPDSNSNIPTGFVAKFHVPATAEFGVYRVKFYATVFGEESFEGESVPLTAGIKMDYNILPDYSTMDGSLVETANLKTGLIKPDKEFTLDVPFGTQQDDETYAYSAYDPLLVHNDSSLNPAPGKSVLALDHAFPTPEDCKAYYEAHQLSGTVFGVKPGYTVSVRFSRAAPSDGTPYVAPIGFLNLRWAIEQVVAVDVSQTGQVNDLVTQTVLNLRKAASKSSRMKNSDDLVTILTRLINAMK